MSSNLLVLRVTVVEEDEQGNVVSRLSQHSESFPLPGDKEADEQRRGDYCHWAYKGFNLARNGALGLAEEADPAIPLFSLLVLKTPQVEKVKAFYQALGINFVEEKHGDGPLHYAGRLRWTVFEVYPLKEGSTPDRTTRLGFAVQCLAKVTSALQTLGAPFINSETTIPGSKVIVRDPDGRAVELYQTPSSFE